MKRLLFVLAGLVLFALSAHAQGVVVGAATAVFTHSDSDYAISSGYHVDIYTCASVTPLGVCVGKSSTPLVTGFDVVKAAVTGPSTARVIDMKATAPAALLATLSPGVGAVATIRAVGDTSIPGITGTSPESPASNAFFAQARTPAAPGSPVVK